MGQIMGGMPDRSACERNPSMSIEPKPACDQAARLRAALEGDVAPESARVLVTGAKGGVGATAVAAALNAELAQTAAHAVDRGRDLPGAAGESDAWVLVTTPEPASLASAFDTICTLQLCGGRAVTPLVVVNRSPSFAASRRAFDRLGEALRAVGVRGTVFAGHVPFDQAFARSQPGPFRAGRSPAHRACRAMARRLAEFLFPVVLPVAPAVKAGANP